MYMKKLRPTLAIILYSLHLYILTADGRISKMPKQKEKRIAAQANGVSGVNVPKVMALDLERGLEKRLLRCLEKKAAKV